MLKKKTNDVILWCVIAISMFLSFYFFYYSSNYLLVTRIVVLLLSFIFSTLLFVYTGFGNYCLHYAKDAFKEVHSITWPSKKETMQTTLVISGMVIILGTILCLIDILFFGIVKWVGNFG